MYCTTTSLQRALLIVRVHVLYEDRIELYESTFVLSYSYFRKYVIQYFISYKVRKYLRRYVYESTKVIRESTFEGKLVVMNEDRIYVYCI